MSDYILKITSLGSLFITFFIITFVISLIPGKKNILTFFLKKYGIHIIFITSLVATIGSLVLSFMFDFIPCDLCWYQRIFMYPITFVSGLALYKKDFKNGVIYSLPLAFVGFTFALYNYYIQIVKIFGNIAIACSPTELVDCSVPDFIYFGFVTTPYMSLVIFTLIIFSGVFFLKKD